MKLTINEHDPTLIRRVNVQIIIYQCMCTHRENEAVHKVLTKLYEDLMEHTSVADSVDMWDWMEEYQKQEKERT